MDKRTLFIRVVAIVCAVLIFGSMFAGLFFIR